MMKHQVDQSQLKKWIIILGISWFLFSVVFPTRYLFSVELVSGILFLLLLPMIYSAFQAFYILKNRELKTYADILNFLNPEKKVTTSLSSEFWFTVGLIMAIFITFFAGTVVSALIFWH